MQEGELETVSEDVVSDSDDHPISIDILLRNYQLQLLEIAKTQNSIIYLPTGSGKTLIAIHVLCSRLQEINRDYSDGGKRAFFMGTTKVMVHQLAKDISIHTKFKVGFYTGDMNVDMWSKDEWLVHFKKYQVLVLTPEILRSVIQLQFISFKQISLLVFDECHHAVSEHPYRAILHAYARADPSERPLLLGLSAVLLNSNPKPGKVPDLIHLMENAFCGAVITHSDLGEVMSFSTTPFESFVTYRKDDYSDVHKRVEDIVKETVHYMKSVIIKSDAFHSVPKDARDFKNRNKAKLITRSLENLKTHLSELGTYCGSLATLFYIIFFEKLRLMSQQPAEIQCFVYVTTSLNKIRRVLLKEVGEESWTSIFRNSSSKVQALLQAVSSLRKKHGENLSLLVFVQQRLTAIVLASMFKKLHEVDPDFEAIRPDHVVGSSSIGSESAFLGLKTKEVMKKFKTGALNLLVSTNLLEEGVDVPCCNNVMSFDFPLAYPGYFQSRGRARSNPSYYYLFVDEEERHDKQEVIEYFRDIDRELRKVLLKDQGDSLAEGGSEEALEEFSFPGKSRTITIDGILAIKTVMKYCASLPQDKFSHLFALSWYKETPENEKVAFVQLPTNCPLRAVMQGDAKKSSKAAKRSAFLKTVKRLYDLGQLDDYMNAKSVASFEEDYDYLFPHYKREKTDGEAQPGTNKRKQVYSLEFAGCLTGCLPQPDVAAYVHVVNMTVAFERPGLARKVVLYNLLLAPVTFALLSSKKLSRICPFSLFLDMGEVKCELLVNYDRVTLTEAQLNEIKLSHYSLFKKVTRTLKDSQVFDNRNKEHSFLVAPVKKNEEDRFVLNWDTIKSDFCQNNKSAVVRYNPSSGGVKRNAEELHRSGFPFHDENSDWLVPMGGFNGRLLWACGEGRQEAEPKFAMSETDYRFFVISPNYRKQDIPQCYVVDKFCRDLSPFSPFPRSSYKDYVAYYRDKYNLEITNPDQPLLKVTPIYPCSNFNLPKNTSKVRKERQKDYDEHLIPELCDVFPFDSQYWLKAVLLPTALNRIAHVYVVDEFRRKIVAETGLGVAELPETEDWSPLGVDAKCLEEQEPEAVPTAAAAAAASASLSLSSLEHCLPLSTLRGKTTPKVSLMDIERHLFEVSVCDMEEYARTLKSFDFEQEEVSVALQQDNFHVLHLISLQNMSIPGLSIFRDPADPKGPELADLVTAFTSKSAKDVVNYERLEVVGDSFLKFAVTLFLFRTFSENEGILSALKGKLVGNRNLLYCGSKKNIQGAINVIDFVPLADWNPPLLCVPERLVEGILANNVEPAVISYFEIPPEEQVSGNLSESTFAKNEEILRHYNKCFDFPSSSLLPYKVVSDKTVADCVEALLGVYLRASGLPGAFDLLRWFEILPRDATHAELLTKPHCYEFLSPGGEPAVMNILREVFYPDLEKTIGYTFKNKALLLEALTHPTYMKNQTTHCYQRLELLGDAILDFLITTHVSDNCRDLGPGEVTDIRSSLVNNVTFACLVVRYEIQKYLLFCSSTLGKAIESFVTFQTKRNHAVDENVMFLLEEGDALIAETVQVPKALGDVFESLAGAIFLDSGNSLEAVWNVYYRMMKGEIEEFMRAVPKSSVRLLHEICGDKPYFETKVLGKVKVSCTARYRNHEITTHGFGANKREAKKASAKLALKQIMELKH